MRIVILLGSLLLLSASHAQISFYKIFSNNGYDYGQGVVQLEDSSYVICGGSSSFMEAPSQAFLLKLDSLGNYKWSHHYGGVETDWGRRVLYKKNFGFYVAGHTNSMGNGAFDFYLVKTDENGLQEWERTYGGSEWEKVNSAAMTKDTGVLMVGESNSTIGGDNDIYLVRTNKLGDTLWTKKFGGFGEDRANEIKQWNDTTFIVVGELYVNDSLQTKGFVMRIRDNGIIDWIDTIGPHGNYGLNAVNFINNRINFGGWYFNPTENDLDEFFGRVQPNGTYDYGFDLYSIGPRKINCIISYGSAGKQYMVYQHREPTSFPVGHDIMLIRADEFMWYNGSMMTLGHPEDDVPGELIPTSDGGAMFVGYTSYFGSGGSNVFVIKIGENDVYPSTALFPTPNSLVTIEEVTAFDAFNVYPNPATDFIQIDMKEPGKYAVALVDCAGKVLQNTIYQNSIQLSLIPLSSGVYSLQIMDEFGNLLGVKRVIKY